ncbi:MAG: TraR/DksA C4-type zinc finger protein, partial [Deltaproteobacteria bacterium]|nr:TraR/DksA C4-type zinc finger protein [Deltaproteobacteria bacterium]
SCGEEIGLERLRARPVTTLCIDCKTEEELQEKRNA